MIRTAQATRRPNFSAVVVKSKLAPASRLTNWLSIAFSLASSAAMRASYARPASWSTSLMRSGDPGHRVVAAFGDRFLVQLRARQLHHWPTACEHDHAMANLRQLLPIGRGKQNTRSPKTRLIQGRQQLLARPDVDALRRLVQQNK